ncbi:leucine-rich repeat domain-containing protein, partial [Akkermansiaceae bacterium]|nr:leucine-rich repeat domain-containing protein [Akkermansiaceae bacterium]
MKPIQVLLALFAFAFLPLHAASLDDLTWTTTGGEVTITDCDEAATGELVIPATIGGNPVTSIGIDTFRSCTSLTSIT